ncbi:U3 small nucleolar RNA-associated protein 15 [Acrasis kona]|uniref:U3 small nucleolar RNA-associated protein 15 n=1 Tax=Acrasis kona TaxID=1008807 RepID=A0AAW2ZK06_9EUKA
MGNESSRHDGSDTIVSACSDNTLKLWDMNMHASYRTFEGHKGAVKGVSRVDETRFLSCATDANTHLWDVNSGNFISYKGGKSTIESIATIDNNTFATGDNEGVVRCYDIRNTDTHIQLFTHHRRPIRNLIQYNNTIITGAGDGQVAVFQLNKPQPIRTINIGASILSLASLGGNLLAAGTDSQVSVCHINSGNKIKSLEFGRPSHALIGTDDPCQFIIGCEDGMHGRISMMHFKKGSVTKQYRESHNGKVTAFNYLKNKNTFVSACSDGSMKVWDTNETNAPLHHIPAHDRSINALCHL